MAIKPAPKGAKDPKANEPEAEAAAQADAKKAAKKRMLITVGAVLGGLLLGGGGVGGYFLFIQKSALEKTPATEVQAKAAEEKPAPEPTAFVNLPNLSAPLLDNGKVLGYVLLDFSLEVSAGADEDNVSQLLPALRAAFLIDVTQHPIGTPQDPSVIDYDGLTRRLLDVANREVGDGGVKRVLVTKTSRL